MNATSPALEFLLSLMRWGGVACGVGVVIILLGVVVQVLQRKPGLDAQSFGLPDILRIMKTCFRKLLDPDSTPSVKIIAVGCIVLLVGIAIFLVGVVSNVLVLLKVLGGVPGPSPTATPS